MYRPKDIDALESMIAHQQACQLHRREEIGATRIASNHAPNQERTRRKEASNLSTDTLAAIHEIAMSLLRSPPPHEGDLAKMQAVVDSCPPGIGYKEVMDFVGEEAIDAIRSQIAVGAMPPMKDHRDPDLVAALARINSSSATTDTASLHEINDVQAGATSANSSYKS